MLEFTHNYWMVAASFAIALFAGFSGLSLLRGASSLPIGKRKFLVAVASIVLGGGIWSMHFVAMLGLQLPVQYYYDGLTTLASALVAILVVGLALLVLHFAPRTPLTMTAAGSVLGAGISAMHYIGMLGMKLCEPVFLTLGVAISLMAALVLSSLAIWVAYGARTRGNILLGTIGFATAVFSMHFIAMAGTEFYPAEFTSSAGPALDNSVLAMLVALSSFVISGVSLLSGVSFFASPALPHTADGQAGTAAPATGAPADTENAPAAPLRVPFERDGGTRFAASSDIAAVRAEGHYTILYVGEEKLFCSWSISEAASRLEPQNFIRAHRSYLINPAYVSEFQRAKDTGFCLFDAVDSLQKVPVSRSRLAHVREALGV